MIEELIELVRLMGKVNTLVKAYPAVLSAYSDPYNAPHIRLNLGVFRSTFRGCVVKSERAGRYMHLSYECEGVRFTACQEIDPIVVEVMI